MIFSRIRSEILNRYLVKKNTTKYIHTGYNLIQNKSIINIVHDIKIRTNNMRIKNTN